jgi:c(7)-type cytochrome triheme protein
MKRFFAVLVFVPLFSMFFYNFVSAQPDVKYEIKTQVIFSHKAHLGKGLKCADCHPKIFPKMKAHSQHMTMAEMEKGGYCGTCHTGAKGKPFSVSNCKNCHTDVTHEEEEKAAD